MALVIIPTIHETAHAPAEHLIPFPTGFLDGWGVIASAVTAKTLTSA